MADRFYLNCELFSGNVVKLNAEEAHHLAAVRRFHPGDRVFLFNGNGREYPATIVEIGRRTVALEIGDASAPQRELPIHVEVAAPIPKGDRARFLVEKLTELGVARFVPLRTERSVITPREAKLDKLQRYVIEASKQSGRNLLMDVSSLTEWSDYCQSGGDGRRIVAHPSGDAESLSSSVEECNCRIAVGPEGGFTDEEVELGRTNGWRVTHLGARIFRMETAAVALASWFSLGNPRRNCDFD